MPLARIASDLIVETHAVNSIRFVNSEANGARIAVALTLGGRLEILYSDVPAGTAPERALDDVMVGIAQAEAREAKNLAEFGPARYAATELRMTGADFSTPVAPEA